VSEYGRRFLPDEGQPHPEVLGALAESASLATEQVASLLTSAAPRLRALFRTAEPVVVLPVSGGVLREIGLRAAVEQRVLVVVTGPESAALADTAEALGREVIRVMVHPGKTLDPDALRRFLQGPEVDCVVLVHGEGGTGALTRLPELARVVRARPDVLLFVDAGRTLGASPVETGEWGLDFVLAPSEGPLALSAGLEFAVASPRLIARAQAQAGRGVQLDLLAHHAAAARGATLGRVPAASALTLLRQLDRLEREGLEARWGRHAELRALVDHWVAGRGDVTLVAGAAHRLASLSCLRLAPGRSSTALAAAMQQQGWDVGTGLGADRDEVIRIGHMGETEPEQLAALLEELGRMLGE
jgi:aspartate aminotransferase-like enzyme